MKKITLLILLLIGTTTIVNAQLINPSFEEDSAGETNPTGWTFTNHADTANSTVTVVADTDGDGVNSLLISQGGGSIIDKSFKIKIKNDYVHTFTAAGGETIEATITYKRRGNMEFGGTECRVDVLINANTKGGFHGNTGTNIGVWKSWTDVHSETAEAGSNTIKLQIQAGKLPIDATANFDAFELQITVDGVPLSTEDITISDSSISLYPNPTSGILNYRGNNRLESVEVYNILGQQVLEEKIASGSIDISSLNSGMYILKLKGENGAVSTKKFSVK